MYIIMLIVLYQSVRTGNTEHVSESLQGCDDIKYLQQAERELLTACSCSNWKLSGMFLKCGKFDRTYRLEI